METGIVIVAKVRGDISERNAPSASHNRFGPTHPLRSTFSLYTFNLLTICAQDSSMEFPENPLQSLERTCFQTAKPRSPQGNPRSDVAICCGIDSTLPDRVATWKNHGHRVHLMTKVAWGQYQHYLHGRLDGKNDDENAQTDRNG